MKKLLPAARADTPRHLLAFQRTLKHALTRPLTDRDETQARWIDGRPMAEFAADFIKSNDRLTALERLQVYNRMYWFRLLDSFHEDCPGLRAALGARAFTRLAEAYLVEFPSSSFTLRNLCRRLPDFVRARPKWTAPHTALAFDIARFEWAQTVAFDEPARPVMTAAEIGKIPPAKLKLGLQPYVTLLALRYPVDNYVIAVKRRDALRAEASNATVSRPEGKEKRVVKPRAVPTWLAVHRLDNRLFYKRLEPAAFKILAALQAGRPLTAAVAAGGRAVKPDEVRDWFATWMQLGWFCRRNG